MSSAGDTPARTWRGTALLQGAVARWGKTDAGEKARKLRDEILDDPKKAALVQAAEEKVAGTGWLPAILRNVD